MKFSKIYLLIADHSFQIYCSVCIVFIVSICVSFLYICLTSETLHYPWIPSSNLVAKIKLLLQENKSDKSNESLEETNKKKQELLELETQYEQLSRAQEELKQKMQL